LKKAVFLHGTDANPNDNWWSWLRKTLEERGYEIYAPILPDNHTPNRKTYEEFLKNSGWDFSDNLIIGHSSGATTVLNLLLTDWFPKVKTVVLVGIFLNENLTKTADWYEEGQFDSLFLDKYDPEKISKKANNFYLVHGDNDPYCDINDAKELAKKLKAKFITIYNGHHLWNTSGINELPELITALNADNVL
jgi:predicted alpha/beta hydrolase family esterase